MMSRAHTKQTLRRAGRVTALVAGAALLLTACAAGGGDTADSAADGPTEFIFGVTSVPSTLNSATISTQDTAMIANNVFDGLVMLDRSGQIQPMIATAWELSGDGLELKMTIRDDVTFHDGEPLTSSDVKFTLEEGVTKGPYSAWMPGVFKEVVIEDDYNFTIVLEKPFAPLLNAMTRERMPLLPEHIFGTGEDITANPANLAPIGSGPYKFESWAEDDTVTLVKNEEYWDEIGSVETIKMRVIPDRTALANSLLSGEIDFIQNFWIPMEQVAAFETDPGLEVQEGRVYPTFTYLSFNTQTEALSTPAARKAIYKAIDNEYVIESAFMGLGSVPDGFIPSRYDWARSDEVGFEEELATYDPEGAVELLDEAGLAPGADGVRAKLRFVYSPEVQANTQTIAEAVRANLAEVGIELELVPLDAATYVQTVFSEHDFDLTALRLNTGGDPSLGIARVYQCNADSLPYRNPAQYCSPEMDAAWADMATTQGEDRAEAALRAQQIALRDLPSVPLVDEASYDAISGAFTDTTAFFDAFEHASVRPSTLR